MKRIMNFASAGLLIGGPALYAQQNQQPSTQPQDQSVYHQQNSQDQQSAQNNSDQDRSQDQDWNRNQQVHRDRDKNWNNQADQDRDRVNQDHQYNNGQNGTYTDQQRDRDRTYNNGQYNNGQYDRSDRDREYGTDQDRDRDHGRNASGDRERTYSMPQNDQYGAEMSPAQRSGWRDGIAAGRSDREAGRNFSPRPSSSQFEGTGQDRQLYRQAFQQGYRRGYYGNNGNNTQYPR